MNFVTILSLSFAISATSFGASKTVTGAQAGKQLSQIVENIEGLDADCKITALSLESVIGGYRFEISNRGRTLGFDMMMNDRVTMAPGKAPQNSGTSSTVYTVVGKNSSIEVRGFEDVSNVDITIRAGGRTEHCFFQE